MRSRCCPCVCLCIPTIVARQRLRFLCDPCCIKKSTRLVLPKTSCSFTYDNFSETGLLSSSSVKKVTHLGPVVRASLSLSLANVVVL
jgi:hypothetical protein